MRLHTDHGARLYADHADEVLRHCLRQLGSRTEAEDAVQTTFLYALRALGRGEMPKSEIAWLIAIATNVCRSQRRTLSRRAPVADAVDIESLPDSGRQHDHDLLIALPRALASIPERQRRALLLREWRGLPTREVAGVLGMSATATHALLTRARQSLAHALLATQRTLALNVLGLVAPLRKWLAGWFAGAGSKAAVTAVLVVGVVAGVGTQIDTNVERAPRAPTLAVVPPVSSESIDADSAAGAVLSVATSARRQRTSVVAAPPQSVTPAPRPLPPASNATPAPAPRDAAPEAPGDVARAVPAEHEKTQAERTTPREGPRPPPLRLPVVDELVGDSGLELPSLPVEPLPEPPDLPDLPVEVVPALPEPSDLVTDLPVPPLPADESPLP